MDIESLRTFLTLADVKSFTKTAELHFVVQSTITNRIAELEKELGRKLFVRDRKSVILTEEGLHFIGYAKRIIELKDAAQREIESLKTFCGTLRIGTVNTVYDCHLYPLISAFLKKHRDISVKVITGHSNDLIRMLADNTIDVAFTFIPVQKSSMNCTPFRTDELIFVTSGRQHTRGIRTITKEELKDQLIINCDFIIEGGTLIRDLLPEPCAFPFEIDNGSKLIPYLKDGLGGGFVPRKLVEKELKNGSLNEIEITDLTLPGIQSYVLTGKKTYQSETIHKWLLELTGQQTA